jgi:large subunit ribosomal protein L35
MRQFSTCLRCVRPVPAANGAPQRMLSSSASAREEVQTQPAADATPPPPPQSVAVSDAEVPEYMQKWGKLDPEMVENKKQERRLLRREGVQPVGSRRRRAALRLSTIRNTEEIPFEQLPYQCFQEARKFLQEDRMEKLKEIKHQQQRIQAVAASDASEQSKRDRIAHLKRHVEELVIQADINDPTVKRKFEDGQGMSKSGIVNMPTSLTVYRRHEQAHLPLSGREEVARVQAQGARAARHTTESRP